MNKWIENKVNIVEQMFNIPEIKKDYPKMNDFFTIFKYLFLNKEWSFFDRFINLFKNKNKILKNSKKRAKELKNEIVWFWLTKINLSKFRKLEKEGVEWYKKIAKTLADINWVPQDIFINLINKENSKWNPKENNNISTAYWLWQMTDNTWGRFWTWNRKNPINQLLASINFLKYIKNYKKCTWEEATAFYNTWENFNKDSDELVSNKIIKWNFSSIIKKIPWLGKVKNAKDVYWKVTNKQYFIAASAYYSWKKYSDIV